MIKDKWYFTYHHNPKQKWSLPRGFAEELKIQKVQLIVDEVSDPDNMRLPSARGIKNKRKNHVCRF